jgi:hypothetical protein
VNLEFPLYRAPPHEHAGKIVYLVMLVPFLVGVLVLRRTQFRRLC